MGKILKLTISFVLLATIAVISIAGWLSSQLNTVDDVTLGKVDVEILACFEYLDEEEQVQCNSSNIDFETTVEGEGTFTKFGVYRINLSSEVNPQFISKFRVDVNVYSNIDTYFRLAPYEQLTLTYSAGGNTYEVATTQQEKMPFIFSDNELDPNGYFYDNRNNDGYFYFSKMVKKLSDGPLVIPFIVDFDDSEFTLYEQIYSLQIGFIIEAVQSIDGPLQNWGLPTRPWDEEVW